MRLCRTDDLKENSIIASSVMTHDYQVLLAEGTILKKEYIEKLKELGIQEVYIEEQVRKSGTSEEDDSTVASIKKETERILKDKVREILEKHTYQHNQELMELIETADIIITDILKEKKVLEQIIDIKERSSDIYEHSISACTLSTILAMKLNLAMEQIHDIAVGALLHDIGLRYLTIPYQDQNIDELKDYEKIEFKKHPVYGYTTLKDESWISERSKNIILYHHEKLDASGFPLRANSIPIESQIVAVCDIFDEMICGIGCIRAKVYEAVEYLKYAMGKHYDKNIVTTFLKITAVYPVGTHVRLNDGRIALVIQQNNQFPERPILKIDQKDKEELIDLLKFNNLFIEEVIS